MKNAPGVDCVKLSLKKAFFSVNQFLPDCKVNGFLIILCSFFTRLTTKTNDYPTVTNNYII